MKLLMFSGNSLRNREWIYRVEKELSGLSDQLYIQDYQHWANGEDWIDLARELAVIKERSFEGDYAVFAKSIGTVLSVQAIEQDLIKPKFLLFCGLPLDYITKRYPQFVDELKKDNLPVTVIHNTNDKVGSALQVRDYLSPMKDHPNFKFIETPGDTHDYEDYDLLRKELDSLLKLSR